MKFHVEFGAVPCHLHLSAGDCSVFSQACDLESLLAGSEKASGELVGCITRLVVLLAEKGAK